MANGQRIIDGLMEVWAMKDPDDEDPQIIVCQGPSLCDHVLGDGKELPCPMCRIITCHPDGTETYYDPANRQ